MSFEKFKNKTPDGGPRDLSENGKLFSPDGRVVDGKNNYGRTRVLRNFFKDEGEESQFSRLPFIILFRAKRSNRNIVSEW